MSSEWCEQPTAFRPNDRLSAVTTEATGFEPVEWFTFKCLNKPTKPSTEQVNLSVKSTVILIDYYR